MLRYGKHRLDHHGRLGDAGLGVVETIQLSYNKSKTYIYNSLIKNCA